MKNRIIVIASLLFCTSTSFAQEDPYIWMEEVESEKSMAWVHEQNKITSDKLEKVDGFDALLNEYLAKMNDQEKIDYPRVIDDMVYNFWKDENHVRGIWRRTTKDLYLENQPEWETVLDLDHLSEVDGKKWVFKGANWLAPTYERCLISLADGGTDEHIIREFNVMTMQFVEDGFELPSSKGNAAWVNENELIIAREFGEGSLTTSGYPRIVKRIKRGQSLDKAETIMEVSKDMTGLWGSSQFIDGEYLLSLYKSTKTFEHEVYVQSAGKFDKLNIQDDAGISGPYDGNLLLTLNSDWTVGSKTYPQGDVVSVDFDKLLAGSIEVSTVFHPDDKSSVEGITFTKDGMLINVIQNVKSVLYKCNNDNGNWKQEKISTPEFGRISIIEASRKESEFFYQYSDFITPPTLYLQNGLEAKVIRQGKSKFESSNLEVHQYEVTSKDGTTVPYFIVHDKDIKYDGSNPTLVYAYGGFNASMKPSYNSRTGIGWLQKGGVYVLANIRGGGEFGPAWHQDAMKEKRQNAYDDFYVVCEDLIERKITTKQHLGAFGWSNGGLMAGVVATQRPDLFNAVIIGAPLLDMKRYNKMLAGASWMGEYGNPDLEEDWAYIKKYSPYHNVHKDKEYPEVFFITSTKDDRVHPAHARKMAARMIEQGHPLFYYETVEGGHGASSTNEQAAFNEAIMFSYLKLKLM